MELDKNPTIDNSGRPLGKSVGIYCPTNSPYRGKKTATILRVTRRDGATATNAELALGLDGHDMWWIPFNCRYVRPQHPLAVW